MTAQEFEEARQRYLNNQQTDREQLRAILLGTSAMLAASESMSVLTGIQMVRAYAIALKLALELHLGDDVMSDLSIDQATYQLLRV